MSGPSTGDNPGMNLTRELAYAAPVPAVLAMLQDAAFWDQVAAATGARESRTTVERIGDVVEVVTDQQQDVVGVPSFAKRFVGDSTQAIVRQTWRGEEAGYVVDSPGKPISISGSATVTATGTGSLLTYDLEVKAGVPLVGGKLERLVCDLTTEGLEKEHAVGAAWLARESSQQ